MSQRLQGKRAIVTGGASGIGRGVAIKLAAEGASVAVLDVYLETAEQIADSIRKAGGKTLPLRVKVADEAQMAGAVSEVERLFSGLDTVIDNAEAIVFGRDTVAAFSFATSKRK